MLSGRANDTETALLLGHNHLLFTFLFEFLYSFHSASDSARNRVSVGRVRCSFGIVYKPPLAAQQ
ncbi:uncharacterized protein BDW70DRAFT_125681 [Aspergillus foveolatus]|uniref:uncharacterized protein n=1 Tax=Aspergillus foveolatus TaxID=210207 RepID=UPI003CCCDB94